VGGVFPPKFRETKAGRSTFPAVSWSKTRTSLPGSSLKISLKQKENRPGAPGKPRAILVKIAAKSGETVGSRQRAGLGKLTRQLGGRPRNWFERSKSLANPQLVIANRVFNLFKINYLRLR
jgi:hypothetical protein